MFDNVIQELKKIEGSGGKFPVSIPIDNEGYFITAIT